MATIKHFSELKSWQEAKELNQLVFKIIPDNREIKDFELKNQLNGSAGSVMDNIAEGVGRGGTRELILFLRFALGSLAEVESQLCRSLDRSFITDQELKAFANKVRGMLISFMNYSKKSDYRGVKFKMEEPEGECVSVERVHNSVESKEPSKLKT